MWDKLEKIDYEILLNKFIENFNVNHITLDIMEFVSYDDLKQFIINKFLDEFKTEEIEKIFNIIKEE